MKTRTGYIDKTATGFRVRFRVRGKPVYFRLKATDEASARLEADKLSDRMTAKDNTVVADGLRTLADRIETQQSSASIKLADMWAEYVASRKRPSSSTSTLSAYEIQAKAFTAWAGDITMEGVTPTLADRYAAHLDAEAIKGGTVNKHLALLRLMWKVLLPRRDNPWVGMKTHLPDQSTRHLAFTEDQLKAILNRLEDGELKALLWVLAYTGLRLGDACCLQVGQVHLGRRVVELYPAKTGSRGTSPMLAKIGIHAALEPVLRARVAGKAAGMVLPDMAALYARDRSAPAKLIARHLEACGLVRTVDSGQGRASCLYGAHSFRHTLQTMLNNAEIHPMVSDVILCHKTGSMAQHYSHVSDAKVVEAIEKAMPGLWVESKVIKLEQVS